MQSINFTIPGIPVAKARARIGKHGGYTPAKTKLYERHAAYYAREAMKGKIMASGAVVLQLEIMFPVPKSFSKKKREMALSGELKHLVKPDVSNVLKSCEDAFNGIIYHDDSQIFHIICWKFYSENPHVEVKVSWEE